MGRYLAAFPFVHPAIAAAGIACGAIPVIIHLINRRRHRRVPWAAMRFLLAANRRSARRMWIEQWLLLAMRVLLVVLLGWAVARPYLPMSALFHVGAARLHHILVVDNSGSMNAEDAEGHTEFDRGRDFAQQLLSAFDDQDAVSLVTLAEPAQAVIAHAAYDHRFVREQLAAVKPTYSATDVLGGLRAVSRILNESDTPQGNRVVYVISDFSRSTWIGPDGQPTAAAIALRSLSGADGAARAQVHLVQVAPAPAANLAVIGLSPESSLVGTTLPVRINVTIENLGVHTAGGATFQLRRDGDIVRRESLPSLAPQERLVLPVTMQFAREGDQIVEARVVPGSADALSADNARYLALDVREATPVLLVDGRTGSSLIGGQAGYLATALSPWSASRPLEISPRSVKPTTPVAATVVSAGEFGAEDWSKYDVIALCNVSRLSKERWRQLTDYVEAGGGLLIFAGDAVDVDNYNRYGYDDGHGLLPGRFSTTPGDSSVSADLQFALTKPANPLVQDFVDHPESGLFRARVDHYLPLSLDSNRAELVLTYTDGAPALAMLRVGEGRVAVCTTTADMSWTNLPAKGDFVSLMYQLVAHLTRDRQSGLNVTVGADLKVPLTAVQSSLPLEVRAPDGATAAPLLTPVGSMLAATYGPLTQPGFYHLSIGTDQQVTAVNVPLDESLTEVANADSLERVTGLTVQPLDASGVEAAVSAGARATELSRTTVWIVLGFLFFEAWLAMTLAAGREGTPRPHPVKGRRRLRTA